MKTTTLAKVSVGLLITGAVVAVTGYVVAQSGIALSAVRQGALTLAVGNIVSGNSFEVLVVAAADFVYLDGSLLHATTKSQSFIIALTALLRRLRRDLRHGLKLRC